MTILKNHKALILFFLLFQGTVSVAQTSAVPQVQLLDLDGGRIDSGSILNKEGFTVISFWATWCKPCILELNELNDLKEDWNEEVNVKIVGVSIDDSRSSAKVPAFTQGRGWDFEVYLDQNSDFKRALNISNIPHSILVDKAGNIVWQHAGYSPGDEEILYEELLQRLD